MNLRTFIFRSLSLLAFAATVAELCGFNFGLGGSGLLLAMVFGNADRQKVQNINSDNRRTFGDNAVLNQPRTIRSGNQRNRTGNQGGDKRINGNNNRLIETNNSTVTNNITGFSEDRVSEIIASLRDRDAAPAPIFIPVGGGVSTGSTPDPVGQAINDRLVDNIKEGSPSEQKKIPLGFWIVAGVGTLLVGFVLWKLLRRKRSA